MKSLVIILSLLAVVIVSLFFTIPQYANDEPVIASIVIDKTDSFSEAPNISEIFRLLHIGEHKWNSINLRIQTISNFDFNSIESVSLPSRFALLSNPYERDREIALFKQNADQAIDSINRLENGKPNSSIYNTIVSEANALASENAKRKVLIVFSDLQENTNAFSIYDPHTQEQAKSHQELARSALEQIATPVNLEGVEVYFIFRPKTDRDNILFREMSTLFASMLDTAGAQVTIAGNLVEQ